MLQSVKLTNFKCFKEQEFPLSGLTILTGLNGMGKSSLLQSFLLLRQSATDSGEIKDLRLNGPYISLGSGQDVLCEVADEDILSISIEEDGRENVYEFDCSERSLDEILPLNSAHLKIEHLPSIFSDRFTYLSAYRIAPQRLYDITSGAKRKYRDFGADGKFVLQYLKEHGGDPISCKEMIWGNAKDASLSLQVQAWMDQISPGVHPIISINLGAKTAELGYEFFQGTNKTMTYKSTNVGFGITYVLPVIVALLSAQKGDLLLIENPEAHIHPKGQRYLGELMARASTAGIQVLLETHSDHVLNGVRIAAKRQLVKADDVTLSYFSMCKDKNGTYSHHVVWPKLFQNGQIDHWPEGFFDEWDNSLLALL